MGSNKNPLPLPVRFEQKVDRSGGPDACHLWTGWRSASGYGMLWRGGGQRGSFSAHRAAYELAFGPIPGGLYVCHRCDNPSCVNPRHLFPGTLAENAADRNAKGRQARGEAIPQGKLTEAQALEVLKLRGKLPQKVIAERLGVHPATVWLIHHRRTWKYLSEN